MSCQTKKRESKRQQKNDRIERMAEREGGGLTKHPDLVGVVVPPGALDLREKEREKRSAME